LKETAGIRLGESTVATDHRGDRHRIAEHMQKGRPSRQSVVDWFACLRTHRGYIGIDATACDNRVQTACGRGSDGLRRDDLQSAADRERVFEVAQPGASMSA